MALISEQESALHDFGSTSRPVAESSTRRIVELLFSTRILWPLALLIAGLIATVAAVTWLVLLSGDQRVAPVLALLSGLVSIFSLLAVSAFLYKQVLLPLTRLERSVAQVCEGEPGASLSLENAGVLTALVRDIESISDELMDLYEDMDNRVARQTTRLAQKTASLKILYDVAASINHADDLDELLLRFLRLLKGIVNARSATVQLVRRDGITRMVGSVDLDGVILREHEMLPVRLCRCGKTLSPGDILCHHDVVECARINQRKMFSPCNIELIEVPLEYQGQVLGRYRLFVERPGVSGREDIMELLATVGSHLGMAVAKQRSDAEARRLSIVEERNNLAHELHDSLAQTLASLRFQVRMMEETLEQSPQTGAAIAEAQRLRRGLDEAHTELRELLTSFRAPLEEQGLIPAMEKLVKRFRQDTFIQTFFQHDCESFDLSASEEIQMLRIVQEALANIRKHAQAHTVRVLLRCRSPGNYVLLVEDDGVGFEGTAHDGHPGEHIGLSIMKERAHRLGAQLRIESEPGEGSRIELLFRPGERLQRTVHEGTG